mmetsp:Transcript_35864/g.55945  ORF Transcript_35864/g.55945 Transcript_35864/m.55945 type:complete len:201 (-) Transcript_35864:381-983(-)
MVEDTVRASHPAEPADVEKVLVPALWSQSRTSLLSVQSSITWGRDVSPRRPHTVSTYPRPSNKAQKPRWQKGEDRNWNPPTYLNLPSLTAKSHYAVTNRWKWEPPPKLTRISGKIMEDRTGIREKDLAPTPTSKPVPEAGPLSQQEPVDREIVFGSIPSSPRLWTHLSKSGFNSPYAAPTRFRLVLLLWLDCYLPCLMFD